MLKLSAPFPTRDMLFSTAIIVSVLFPNVEALKTQPSVVSKHQIHVVQNTSVKSWSTRSVVTKCNDIGVVGKIRNNLQCHVEGALYSLRTRKMYKFELSTSFAATARGLTPSLRFVTFCRRWPRSGLADVLVSTESGLERIIGANVRRRSQIG